MVHDLYFIAISTQKGSLNPPSTFNLLPTSATPLSLAPRLALGIPSQVSSLLSNLVKHALDDPALGEITSLGFDLAISDTSGHLAVAHGKDFRISAYDR